jgi:hypothetical protein
VKDKILEDASEMFLIDSLNLNRELAAAMRLRQRELQVDNLSGEAAVTVVGDGRIILTSRQVPLGRPTCNKVHNGYRTAGEASSDLFPSFLQELRVHFHVNIFPSEAEFTVDLPQLLDVSYQSNV